MVDAGPTWLLVPSPLLGPTTWRPVAAHLRARGHAVAEVRQPASAPTGPDDVLATVRVSVPPDGPVVVVAHSNAGAYVPALARDPVVAGAVLVDAVLPPASGEVALAPATMRARLAELARDGRLPPWTAWFDEADVAELFPDPTTRRAVQREQRRLPLDYFRQSVPVPSGWDDVATAYLAFGDTYATERADAAARGWPVRTLDGGHLHMLVEPAEVAAALLDVWDQVGWDDGGVGVTDGT